MISTVPIGPDPSLRSGLVVYKFSIIIPVRFGDMDAMGHVNNATYLTYFEEARLGYYLNLFQLDFRNLKSLGLILAEATVRFKRPAMATDKLEVFTRVSEFGRKTFTMEYQILNVQTRKLIAEGTTVQVVYDYEKGTTISVSDEMKKKILKFENNS